MKLGYIDIGSNSIRLLRATVKNGRIIDSVKDIRTTRLSKGVDSNGYLSEDSIARSIEALKDLKQLCVDYGTSNKIVAIATSAIRDSKNREVFASEVRNLGIDIHIITGDEEAYLGFMGVVKGLNSEEGNIMVVDIGGGSTELVIGNGKEGILDKISLDMGAVRMTERHIKQDPPSEHEILKLRSDINSIVKDFKDRNRNVVINKVLGIGGTLTNMGAIDQKLQVYDRNKIHGYELNKNCIDEMIIELCVLDDKSRKNIIGLQKSRSDVIISGSIIAQCILEDFSKESITISESDNLEGFLFENFK